MIRRPRRSVPATLVALVLLTAAVLITVSCVQLLLDRPPLVPFATLARTASDLTWDNTIVVLLAGSVAALGLVLLIAALMPGNPVVLGLEHRAGQPDAGTTRRSLDRALVSSARGVDGVDKASIRVKPRAVTVTVRTPLHDTGDLPEQVRTALGVRLDDIALAQRPRVRVRADTRST